MSFLASLGTIILMDILLGGDNAVVIAMAANRLPVDLRKKAILIGTAGAVVIRLIMTLAAVWLLKIPYLGALGGLILLPIAVKLLLPEEETSEGKAAGSLMGAIRTIIIADAAMGIDNVLAIAGASHGNFLLVVLGFFISIPIIIGGSTIIGKVMDRFPIILYGGAALLGWTGAGMILHDKGIAALIHPLIGTTGATAAGAIVAAGVVAAGLYMRRQAAPVLPREIAD